MLLQGCKPLLLLTDQEGAPAPSSRSALRAPLDSPGYTAPLLSVAERKIKKTAL